MEPTTNKLGVAYPIKIQKNQLSKLYPKTQCQHLFLATTKRSALWVAWSQEEARAGGTEF